MCRGGFRYDPNHWASRTTDTNLDGAFVENALIFVVPKIGWARTPPLTTPLSSLDSLGSASQKALHSTMV